MSERILKDIELRKLDEEGLVIEGKAVAFDSVETYYGISEKIDKHALDECDMSDVVLRYNHNDSQYTLARTRNKSLILDLREDGLYFKAYLNEEISVQKDAYLMVKDGLIDKCSFAFTIEEEEYDEKEKLNTIKKIDKMFDVALVDFPFYNDTSVEARSLSTREKIVEKAREIAKKNLLRRIKKEELLKKV